MQFRSSIRVALLLTGLISYVRFGRSNDCPRVPAQFDEFVQSFNESHKYRITNFTVLDAQGTTHMMYEHIASAVVRVPKKAFLVIQKIMDAKHIFCDVFTLLKNPDGTLNGHFGEQDPEKEMSLRIAAFDLEKKAASSLVLRMCISGNVINRYAFDLDSAIPLEEGDFPGSRNSLNESCNVQELSRTLKGPKSRVFLMILIVGLVGAFLSVQLVIINGWVKVFGRNQ